MPVATGNCSFRCLCSGICPLSLRTRPAPHGQPQRGCTRIRVQARTQLAWVERSIYMDLWKRIQYEYGGLPSGIASSTGRTASHPRPPPQIPPATVRSLCVPSMPSVAAPNNAHLIVSACRVWFPWRLHCRWWLVCVAVVVACEFGHACHTLRARMQQTTCTGVMVAPRLVLQRTLSCDDCNHNAQVGMCVCGCVPDRDTHLTMVVDVYHSVSHNLNVSAMCGV